MARNQIYAVQTGRYGQVLYETDGGIAAAREWARTALGIRARSDVSVHREYRHCDACDSAPCICPEDSYGT